MKSSAATDFDSHGSVSSGGAPGLHALDRLIQVRVTAALERLASTGHGDVKKLQGRPNDFRLRVGKWRVFFDRETPGTILVTGIDNRGQAY